MFKVINIGSSFTWTLNSPSETKHSSKEFDSFVDDNIIIVRNDSHITGDVIYNDGKSAVIVIQEMTPNLFPFTLFYNEVEAQFPNLDLQNKDPYQKYFCVDVESQTSLFFYDIGTGCLADAIYDEEGDFEYYAKVIDDSTRIVTVILRYLPDRAGAAEGLKEYVRNYSLK